MGQVVLPLECPVDIVVRYPIVLLLLSLYKDFDFAAIDVDTSNQKSDSGFAI